MADHEHRITEWKIRNEEMDCFALKTNCMTKSYSDAWKNSLFIWICKLTANFWPQFKMKLMDLEQILIDYIEKVFIEKVNISYNI